MLSARRSLVALGAVVAVTTVLGGAVVASAARGRRSADPGAAARPARPLVRIPASSGRWIAAGAPLEVTVEHGTLATVVVRDPGGAPVAGAVRAGRRSWRSTAPVAPATDYVVDVTARGPGGAPAARFHREVRGSEPDRELRVTLSPGDGRTVGVGMPLIVRANRPVKPAERPIVESRLGVTSTPRVVGAWRWMSDTELHWRPAAYWPAHTAVQLVADLRGLWLDDGVWGARRSTSSFSIGDAHVSVADVAAHTMTVTSNGQTLRVLPISAGKDSTPTRGGIHLALEKTALEVMDSSTLGIPRNSRDGYYLEVPWSVRISYGGAFVHSAPWSVADQGRRNVSHGCVNLSVADAKWFYDLTLRGDVVDIRGSSTGPVLSDPGMADWNVPWEAWAPRPALEERIRSGAA